MSCGLRRSQPYEASSAGTREPLLPSPSRRSRVRLCLLGPASTHKQKHRAAFVDLQHLAVRAQSDFANWRCASGMQNRQVVEPVGAARIYGKGPNACGWSLSSIVPRHGVPRSCPVRACRDIGSMHNAMPSILSCFSFCSSQGIAQERAVLSHQHFLGDSSSLSDLLCRTDKAWVYSPGNVCGLWE